MNLNWLKYLNVLRAFTYDKMKCDLSFLTFLLGIGVIGTVMMSFIITIGSSEVRLKIFLLVLAWTTLFTVLSNFEIDKIEKEK